MAQLGAILNEMPGSGRFDSRSPNQNDDRAAAKPPAVFSRRFTASARKVSPRLTSWMPARSWMHWPNLQLPFDEPISIQDWRLACALFLAKCVPQKRTYGLNALYLSLSVGTSKPPSNLPSGYEPCSGHSGKSWILANCLSLNNVQHVPHVQRLGTPYGFGVGTQVKNTGVYTPGADAVGYVADQRRQ